MKEDAINWFDIPVIDMDRAIRFYNTILSANMQAVEVPTATGPAVMAAFPFDPEQGVGGSLWKGAGYAPSATHGSVVYLNGGDDLSTILDRVTGAGGTILVPKTSIGENGFFAMFTDSEGNRVGLHSPG